MMSAVVIRIDEDSFIEFGAFAVAAQRSRKEYDALQTETPADGVITGFCEINSTLSAYFACRLFNKSALTSYRQNWPSLRFASNSKIR